MAPSRRFGFGRGVRGRLTLAWPRTVCGIQPGLGSNRLPAPRWSVASGRHGSLLVTDCVDVKAGAGVVTEREPGGPRARSLGFVLRDEVPAGAHQFSMGDARTSGAEPADELS